MSHRMVTARQYITSVLLTIVTLLDSIVSISGLTLMVAQGKYVEFPSPTYLAFYQCCYVIPQVISTPLVDRLAARMGPARLLFFSLFLAACNATVLEYSLLFESLFLFVVSRFLNGLFKHEKLLLKQTVGTYALPCVAQSMAIYWLAAGMVLSGVIGDRLGDARAAARVTSTLSVLTALLAGASYIISEPLKQQPLPVTMRVSAYTEWLAARARAVRDGTVSRTALRRLLIFVSAAVAGSLNQCIYAVVGPHVGLSYTQVGAQLAASLLIQAVAVPRVIQLVPRAWSQRSIAIAAAASLAAGCWLVPWLQGRKDCVVLFYVATTALIDVPAAALSNVLGGEFVSSFPAGEQAYAAALCSNVVQVVKLSSAPLRLSLLAAFNGHLFLPIRFMTMPLSLAVLGLVLNRLPSFALSFAFAGLVAAVYLQK